MLYYLSYQEYLIRINEVFKCAGPKEIKVLAPCIGLTKNLVKKMLKNYNIEEKEFFSGYGEL